MKNISIALLSAGLLALTASNARAAEPSPSTDHPISVAALAGFAINNVSGDGADSFNVYGAGFGVRGGYTLPAKVYVGGLLQYNVGASRTVGRSDMSGRMMNLGGEVGYNFDIAPFTVRPYAGLGLGLAGGDLKLDKEGKSTTAFSLWPGLQGVYNFNDALYAGLDVRYTILFADLGEKAGNANGLGFYGTLGYRF